MQLADCTFMFEYAVTDVIYPCHIDIVSWYVVSYFCLLSASLNFSLYAFSMIHI